MRRGVVVALTVLGAGVILLAVALASVGMELDTSRIERDDLRESVVELEGERDSLSSDREQFQQKVQDQLNAIEHLKAELERTRGQTQEPVAASPQDAQPQDDQPQDIQE